MPTIFSILSIDIYCLTPLSFFPNSAILSTIRLGRSRNFITMVKLDASRRKGARRLEDMEGRNHNSAWKTELDGFQRNAARRVDDMEGRAKLSFAEIK